MWILPVDLSDVRVELSAGPHLLPWYYTEADVDRLAWLLRLVLPGVGSELRLDDAGLKVVADRKVKAVDALVVVRIQEVTTTIEEATERVGSLGARCALLQFPEPQDLGYGWLEREVKAPLYKAIGAWLKRPEHPLAAFNVGALPIFEAAALTTDPTELVELMERALAHRLHHAEVGCEEEDYRRSLMLSAGRRLAERLGRLDTGRAGRPDREPLRAALEVLVNEGRGIEDRARFRTGAQAIEKVGLGRFMGGELSLGPLARHATSTLAIGALESNLPRHAWSEVARARLRARLEARGATTVTAALGGERAASPAFADVPPPVEVMQRPLVEALSSPAETEAAIEVLREVAATPAQRRVVPAALKDRLVRALRWLDEVGQGSSLSERRAGQLLQGVLRLWTARSPDALGQQQRALRSLEDLLEQQPEPWIERVVAVARLRHAMQLVQRQREREDLSRAEDLVRKYLDAATHEKEPQKPAAYLCLAEIAFQQDAYERAEECAEKAVYGAQRTGDRDVNAAGLLTLARTALEEKRFVEAEQRARESLEIRRGASDGLGTGDALRTLAEIALSRPSARPLLGREGEADYAEAGVLAEQALATSRAIDDLHGSIASLVILAWVASSQRAYDHARELASQAVALTEDGDIPQLQANAYEVLGVSCAWTGDRDQAVDFLQKAILIYQALGQDSRVSSIRSLLDRQPAAR